MKLAEKVVKPNTHCPCTLLTPKQESQPGYLDSQMHHPFVPNAPFLYPLKTSENLTVYRKGALGTNRFKYLNISHAETTDE